MSYVKLCVIVAALCSTVVFAEDDAEIEIKLRPQSAAERTAEGEREFYRERDAFAREWSIFPLRREGHELFHLAFHKHPINGTAEILGIPKKGAPANVECNENRFVLNPAEKELLGLAFQTGSLKSNKEISDFIDAKYFQHGKYLVCEIGSVRFVLKEFFSGPNGTQECAAKLQSNGYFVSAEPYGSCRYKYVSSNGESADCLLTPTILAITINLLRISVNAFAMDGRHAVVFMYDALNVDKIVVLKK